MERKRWTSREPHREGGVEGRRRAGLGACPGRKGHAGAGECRPTSSRAEAPLRAEAIVLPQERPDLGTA